MILRCIFLNWQNKLEILPRPAWREIILTLSPDLDAFISKYSSECDTQRAGDFLCETTKPYRWVYDMSFKVDLVPSCISFRVIKIT